MGRVLEVGLKHEKPADRGHEWIDTRIDRRRDAQRYLWTQRKRPAWELLSSLLSEHLRKSGMGATAHQGSFRIAQRTAPSGLAMEGT